MDQARNFYNTILKSSHPLLLSFHLAGKAVPIVFYIIGSMFLNFTPQFITVVLLLSFDFYLTKNITGRKLVQLRWWYDSTDVNKHSNFTFESYKQYAPGPPINAIDSKLFWWSMYVTPVIWGVFAVLCLLRLKIFYLILVIVAMCLTAWNTYGFRCCDRWEPSSGQSDGQDTNNWFALPSVPGFENLSRLANIQSFFQRQ